TGCLPGETPEYSFATWADAVASGQVGYGKWVPADLPESATDIRFRYAIDASHTLVAFQLPDDSMRYAPARCAAAPATAITFTTRPSRWWPEYLRGTPDPRTGTFYTCGDREYFAQVGSRGYFWRQ